MVIIINIFCKQWSQVLFLGEFNYIISLTAKIKYVVSQSELRFKIGKKVYRPVFKPQIAMCGKYVCQTETKYIL